MGGGQAEPQQSAPRGARVAPTEARIMELNRSGLWGGEKIDVEALLMLKSLPLRDAQELLDTVEAKGKGKGSVRNPSNYLMSAVRKMGAGSKRPLGSDAPRPSSKRQRID